MEDVAVSKVADDSLACLTLASPPGNIFTARLWKKLAAAVRSCDEVHGLLIRSDLADFSFGASIEEHRRPRIRTLLAAFHDVWTALRDFGLPVAAVVRGRCLGGGLELALLGHRIFAAPDAELAQPEIRLGVFAPFGSVLLPEKIGRSAAEDLLLTGRSVTGEEALRIGLVDDVSESPDDAARAWLESMTGLSRSSLRHAVAAARHEMEERALHALDAVERRYLDGLMASEDAREGLEAFLARRAPEWRHR